MKRVTHQLLSAVLATGLLTSTVAAQEQDAPSPDTLVPQAHSEAFIVNAQQLANFVDAYVAIKTIGQQYRAKIKSARDNAAIPSLQQQARGEMKSAIIDTGLGLSEYKQIILAANHDSALRSRISAAISEATQSQQITQAGR